ncbi:hypothetical protein N7516_011029 [Penicillium verrucosum]|uniref:uncharacterized protein n=1 Tax=Penicillium verrucosum TaxID=60171 RepID=UPI00254587B2|nr:uncharacterized protein N7516_011029 [Penicillium verrucosum]KAJ5920171.1 hypothetical protein N7516_011029 [Penicillium verrucosum]
MNNLPFVSIRTACTVSLGRPKQSTPPTGEGNSPNKKRKTTHEPEVEQTVVEMSDEESEAYEEPQGET